MELLVNNLLRKIQSSPETPLLWVLREELDLTGTKYGCGQGVCGACTVHLDGAAVPSCLISVEQAEGVAVTTIEGLAGHRAFGTVEAAWLEADVSQCGYCQPGFLMTLTALLAENARPSEDEIVKGLRGICRCGTYPAMRRAIRKLVTP